MSMMTWHAPYAEPIHIHTKFVTLYLSYGIVLGHVIVVPDVQLQHLVLQSVVVHLPDGYGGKGYRAAELTSKRQSNSNCGFKLFLMIGVFSDFWLSLIWPAAR